MMITVVIPVLNSEDTLLNAIQSIQQQTLRSIQILIIDNGSTDSSLTISHQLAQDDSRIAVHSCFKPGLGHALNYGINLVRTKYVARMDSDDIAHPERLERQLIFMEKNPDIDFSGSPAIGFNTQSGVRSYLAVPKSHDQCINNIYAGLSPFVHPTLIGKTCLFKNYPYRPTKNGQDYELFIDLLHAGCRFANLTKPYLIYNTTNVSHQKYITNASISFKKLLRLENFQYPDLLSDSLIAMSAYYEHRKLEYNQIVILQQAVLEICKFNSTKLSYFLFRVLYVMISSRSIMPNLISVRLIIFLIKSWKLLIYYSFSRLQSIFYFKKYQFQFKDSFF